MYDIDIEQPSKEQKKSNIYKGRIVRLEPSLEAAFVEYGGERHGFLPLKEISRDYFVPGVDPNKAGLKEFLREGQEVVVQVDKEERGNKGAALTTFISLAGRYMVLMPNSPTAGGVSRRIEGDDRQALKEAMDALTIPEDMGVIIRTAGVGRAADELQWDLDYLLQVWRSITDAALSKPAPFLIYQESRLIIRALRDYLRADVGEILVDTREMYDEARDFMQSVMPQALRKLKLYEDPTPLFNRYQIESQIENAYERQVRLPSGGSIVVDQTEALTAVDVNSSRATKGSDIEETAFNTNLEAAEEVARQMRLRDLGGLIVIDFIDMNSGKHQRLVEERLQLALKQDRARVQIGRISRFGLLELSRQRLRPSLGESSQIVCPRCEGHGRMRSIESLSLSILRVAEEHAMKENTGQVLVQAPPEIANYLLNEKRRALIEIEQRHDSPIVIVADEQLETPHYNVSRLRDNEMGEESGKPSYQRTTPRKLEIHALTKAHINVPDMPAVTAVRPPAPAPVRDEEPEIRAPIPIAPPPVFSHAPSAKRGFLARLMAVFTGDTAPPAPAVEAPVRQERPNRGNEPRRGEQARRDRGQPQGQRGQGGKPQGGNQGKGQSAAQPGQPKQQQPQQSQQPKAPKPERSEEQRLQDEQRRLESQQRREEQQRKEAERREAQKAENLKREAERRDARAARLAAQAAESGGEVTAAAADSPAGDGDGLAIAATTQAQPGARPGAEDGDAAETTGEGGSRRRRGRRGGRRRRRQEGAPTLDADGQALPQSEIDFEDEEGEEEAPATDNAPRPRAVAAVAAVTVTSVESDFDDLVAPMATNAPVASVVPVAAVAAVAEVAYVAPVEAVASVAYAEPVAATTPVAEPAAPPPVQASWIEPAPVALVEVPAVIEVPAVVAAPAVVEAPSLIEELPAPVQATLPAIAEADVPSQAANDGEQPPVERHS